MTSRSGPRYRFEISANNGSFTAIYRIQVLHFYVDELSFTSLLASGRLPIDRRPFIIRLNFAATGNGRVVRTEETRESGRVRNVGRLDPTLYRYNEPIVKYKNCRIETDSVFPREGAKKKEITRTSIATF